MKERLIVAKFGGTSLADAGAIRQSAKVAIDNNVSLIVVSATSQTTNDLSALADELLVRPSRSTLSKVEKIKSRHLEIAKDLGISKTSLESFDMLIKRLDNLGLSIIGKNYSALLKEIYPTNRHVYRQRLKDIPGLFDLSAFNTPGHKRQAKQVYDHILSFGERFSSVLIADVLAKNNIKVEIVDAKEVIMTDNNHKYATPLLDEIARKTKKVIKPLINDGKVVVTQGFIGRAEDGSTTTLGRGGSDYSAALFTEALEANELQIWSDVPGIATADPRVVENTRPINHLTFQEAAELATAGAKILYPKTITPLRRAGIPVYVGNTFHPELPGTKIEKTTEKKPLVTAIALKVDQSLVTLTSERMAQEFGYLATLFDIFARHKISIDQISTSEISVAFTISGDLSGRLRNELETLGDVNIEKGISAVSLIGNDINNTPGLVSKIFSCLETKGSKIAIRMICQGASKHNFCFLVADRFGEESVRKLHNEFIGE